MWSIPGKLGRSYTLINLIIRCIRGEDYVSFIFVVGSPLTEHVTFHGQGSGPLGVGTLIICFLCGERFGVHIRGRHSDSIACLTFTFTRFQFYLFNVFSSYKATAEREVVVG